MKFYEDFKYWRIYLLSNYSKRTITPDQLRVMEIKLLDHLGIKFSNEERSFPYNSPTWSGKVLLIDELLPGDIAHEIGHWLCASVKNRRLPNHGMGIDPAGGNTERLRDSKSIDQDEEDASWLGITIEVLFGSSAHNLSFHNWLDEDNNQWVFNEFSAHRLIRKKIINQDFIHVIKRIKKEVLANYIQLKDI